MIDKEKLIRDLEAVREQAPLVHNITNYVVMNNTANALLAIGASPVMAHAPNEVEEMVNIASSLVLNIGTLSDNWISAMMRAGQAAHKKGIPIVLDPVGAGATSYRTETCELLLCECRPSIVRGNASEIMSLARQSGQTKGVDSTDTSEAAIEAARQLAKNNSSIVIVSGPTDYITDGDRLEGTSNGSVMMTRVTGLGCTATALIGAFASVNKDMFEASVHAMATMGIAGEIAASMSNGTGSMQVNFLDTLYKLGRTDIESLLKV